MKNHSYLSEAFVNQVILWFPFTRVYLQFACRSWKTFMVQMFIDFCLHSGPSQNRNTLLICYLLSTIISTNVFAISLVIFWNPNHKLICAPSAGYFLLQLKRSITEICINFAYCGDIIDEISTKKNLYWNRHKFPSNLCVLYLGNSLFRLLQYYRKDRKLVEPATHCINVLNYIKIKYVGY